MENGPISSGVEQASHHVVESAEVAELNNKLRYAFKEVPIEKIFTVLDSLQNELEKLGEHLVVATEASKNDPASLETVIDIIDTKERIKRVLEIQHLAQTAVTLRQRNAS